MDREVTVKRVDTLAGHAQASRPADYADSFELHTLQPDDRPALDWLRQGLQESPTAVRWLIVMVHRHVLRFRAESPSNDRMLGLWQIVNREHDDARLEADGPLFTGRLVARRRDPHTFHLDTFLTFNRRPAAPVVWALVGPLHRAIAPRLMARAARGPRTHR